MRRPLVFVGRTFRLCYRCGGPPKPWRRLVRCAVVALMLAIVSVSCSKEPAQTTVTEGTTTGEGIEIAFTTATTPLVSGKNPFEVTIKKDGMPVEDATVTTVFVMPAMPSMNMPEMRSNATLQPAGGGRYTGVGEISMAGTWNVRVTVARDGNELGTKSLSIIAK